MESDVCLFVVCIVYVDVENILSITNYNISDRYTYCMHM